MVYFFAIKSINVLGEWFERVFISIRKYNWWIFTALFACGYRHFHINKGQIFSVCKACTALSGTVGTGNIAGVAGAISIGGAGAIFWMWISALIGMAVKFAEISVSVKYREKKGGNYIGGPMFYIKNGMNKKYKVFGLIYALACLPRLFVQVILLKLILPYFQLVTVFLCV